MRLLPLLLLLSRVLVAPGLVSGIASGLSSEDDLLTRIRRVKIDPTAVYRVRELPLNREDIRIYFNEGVLAFLEPIDGRVTGAIFVGEGETLLLPPDASEKRYLARFTGTPVLNEKFTAAYLRFSDDTGRLLADGVKDHTVTVGPFSREEFIDEWGPVAQNLNLLYDLRLLDDLLIANGPKQNDQAGRGFFAAHMFGQRIGAFDITLDPVAAEPVEAGQVNWKDGKRYTDLWLSFASAFQRAQEKPPARWANDPITLSKYHIDATIGLDRQLEVTAVVDFDGATNGERMLSFQLSHFLKVASVECDGVKLQSYQNEDGAQRSNDTVTLLFPAPIERGKHYSLTFKYSGGVIGDAGHGVLFVGARGIWYPQRGFRPASYDLTFRFPRKFSLAATGDRVEQREEGEWRISRWTTKDPIRVAGFNVGDYAEAEAKSSDGATITVYMNRELEPALEQRRPATVQPMIGAAASRRPPPPTVVPPPPPPSTGVVAPQMAKELAQVVDFFSKNFGPLPFSSLRVSPIPGNFGQGWPGLIYLSTTSYLLPYDTASRAGENLDLFFSSLLPVHEVAHQWWGHAVAPASYRDEWITEALSSYSALLWLEQKDKFGPRNVRTLLARYRQELLAKVDDETAESVRPPALAPRTTQSPPPKGTE